MQQSSYFSAQPAILYNDGQELWVVTARMRLKIEAAEIRFLCRVAGLTLRDKVSSAVEENLCIKLLLLCIEGNQLRWFGL